MVPHEIKSIPCIVNIVKQMYIYESAEGNHISTTDHDVHMII